MNQKSKDPLADLFADDIKSIDRQIVATFLKPYVVFDRASKQIGFLPAFEKVGNNINKVEIILLASKALSLLEGGMPDGLNQGQIVNLGVIPEGSVKSTLKKLFDAKKIKKNKELGYYVPNYRIKEVVEKNSKKQ